MGHTVWLIHRLDHFYIDVTSTDADPSKPDNILKNLNTLHNQIKSKMNGSKENPAQTCATLFSTHDKLKSGLYWIDPNGLSTKDAIQVHCDRETLATCLIAQPEELNFDINRSMGMWLSEVNNGIPLTYKADSSQIRHIQLSSSTVSQTITIDSDKNTLSNMQQ